MKFEISPTVVPVDSIGRLLADRAAAHGSRRFLSFAGEGERVDLDYAAFARRVEALAAHLAEHHGIAEGDRIATLSVNHHDTVTTYFAAWWLGAVVVPISVAEEDDRVVYMVDNCGAKLLVAHASQMARAFELAKRCAKVESVMPVSTAGRTTPQGGSTRPPVERALELDALIVYTSGTTGPPKGVVLRQYNLLADAYAITAWHRFDSDTRLMCVLPIHHVNGTVVTLLTPLVAGGAVTLCRQFHPGSFFELVRADGVQVVSVVPTLLKYLLERHRERVDAGPLRYLICGAGPLTVELATAFEERFGIPILHGYGLSETTCYSCFLPIDLAPDEHRHWMSAHGFPSIGVPLPVNEMAILDAEGKELPPGERGEIVIRGHNIMREYFARPDANADAFRTGWFHSGDEGFWQPDAGGRPYFFITGRLKELIIRGGVKVAPLELDEVLARIPGVRRAIAVGFESSWYGEEVGAYVDPDPAHAPPLTADGVIEHCRRVLPFHKTPKVVLFGADIPVTSTGKYQRNRLKDLFLEYKDVQFREPAKG
jgi:long-chain acyl-CoA synthetase